MLKSLAKYARIIQKFEGKVICQTCGSIAIFIPNELVYGRPYGNGICWVCINYFTSGTFCDSYVGCHEDGTPLGTPADKLLRIARNQAHKEFDKLWKTSRNKDATMFKSENKANRSMLYDQLAEHMNLPRDKCHIGMFSMEQVEVCIRFSTAYKPKPKGVKLPNNTQQDSSLWIQHVDNPLKQEDYKEE